MVQNEIVSIILILHGSSHEPHVIVNFDERGRRHVVVQLDLRLESICVGGGGLIGSTHYIVFVVSISISSGSEGCSRCNGGFFVIRCPWRVFLPSAEIRLWS